MNLKLVTTETFGKLPCNFYRNTNDDILLTREQIGQALEYKNPIKAIQKIHLTHQDRLEPLCLRIKSGHPNLVVCYQKVKNKNVYIIHNAVSWNYAVGVDNQKQIFSWIGYGIL